MSRPISDSILKLVPDGTFNGEQLHELRQKLNTLQGPLPRDQTRLTGMVRQVCSELDLPLAAGKTRGFAYTPMHVVATLLVVLAGNLANIVQSFVRAGHLWDPHERDFVCTLGPLNDRDCSSTRCLSN